ncbi:hypothetical protein P154DRAFT_556182 [Amniculicola lignicola CBS 123094]|uniref:SNF2 family helicase/ATPase-like protein n=1 Tax=Amniculicola lignicola CBS 123094 TaxID=1392246 RepID=A0A6A5W6S2_9PLEO|nr:hypothetical protein P154DRAFT_556182 [Amniculicola lignicola CBS 123094]
MDPAWLLDPKGARARQEREQPRIHQPAYDAHSLLNPKSASKRPASEDRGRELEQGPAGGQLSLVERLHHVQERTASPSKRVKTDNNKRVIKSAPTSSGALNLNSATNGRPAQPLPTFGPAPTPPATAAIDLTMSDDEDEIQVLKDNSSELVCIGRLKQCYIQSHTVPFNDPKKYPGNMGQQARIRVRLRRGGSKSLNILVVDPTGKEFGRIDLKTAQGLAPLIDASAVNGLRLEAVTEPRRKQPGEGPPGSALSTLIALSLQLYCPRKFTHNIGNFLRSKNLQLIDPIFDLNKHNYYNPHNGNNFQTADVARDDFQVQIPGGGSGGAPIGNYAIRSVEEIRHDVQSMFDTMISAEDLPERDQSSMIETPLMSHQKQALFFMTDKEQQWPVDIEARKDCLWKPKYLQNGQKKYVHIITGDESNILPDRPRGGILADEMGLGKTLSILSLIADAESMDAAEKFGTLAPPPLAAPLGQRLPPQQVLNSRATLLICPLSTMVNWKMQIEEHFGQTSLKWCNYHGTSRNNYSVSELADHDLILTTYHIVAQEWEKWLKPLNRIKYFRIVLDEAHTIRTSTTQQSRGVCALAAQRRWAVTGTPVQNRLDDLGALFKFLRVSPFDTSDGFTRHILTPFKNADEDIVAKLQLLVSSVTIRRVKKGLIELPRRYDNIVRLEFSTDERKLHELFEQDSARKVNAVTAGEKLGGHAYASILTAILNLRLICAHGRDLLSDEALKLTDGLTYDNPLQIEEDEHEAPALTRKAAYDMLELLRQTDTARCQYCRANVLENEDDEEDNIGSMTPCYHIICPRHEDTLRKDWTKRTEPDQRVTCQFCESRVRPTTYKLTLSEWDKAEEEQEKLKKDPKLAKKLGAYTGPHTKTKALLQDLNEHEQWSQANPTEAPIKSVVFSSWTTHLDLIQVALDNHGFRGHYTRLDGRMRREARNKALELFADDPTIKIILISIGAGGLGLNLTNANKVYVMEPQFNPQAEAQAVDRVHRLGQTREVTIKRFIMDNSFEEKMLELQEKKRALADLTMAREKTTKEQGAKQRLAQLRSLFR